MCLFTNWMIENILAIVTIIIMVIGGVFALFQWNSSIKIRRAEFLNEIMNKIIFDNDMETIFYQIDKFQNQKGKWFNENFNDSEFECKVDRFLTYINYIIYLKKILQIKNF